MQTVGVAKIHIQLMFCSWKSVYLWEMFQKKFFFVLLRIFHFLLLPFFPLNLTFESLLQVFFILHLNLVCLTKPIVFNSRTVAFFVFFCSFFFIELIALNSCTHNFFSTNCRFETLVLNSCTYLCLFSRTNTYELLSPGFYVFVRPFFFRNSQFWVPAGVSFLLSPIITNYFTNFLYSLSPVFFTFTQGFFLNT